MRRVATYGSKLLAMFGVLRALQFVLAYATARPLLRVRLRSHPTPVWLRPRSTDVRVLYEILGPHTSAIPWPRERPPATVIDGGANVGYSSLAFHRHWPDAFILAVEPDPGNFEVLTRNCGSLAGVHLRQGGIWGTKCSLRIQPNSPTSEWALQFEPVPAGAPEGIRADTVTALVDSLPGGHCDLLKLDIEGAEISVFSQTDLRWMDRVSVILVEPHGAEARECLKAVQERFGFVAEDRGDKVMLSRPS